MWNLDFQIFFWFPCFTSLAAQYTSEDVLKVFTVDSSRVSLLSGYVKFNRYFPRFASQFSRMVSFETCTM